MLGLAEFNEDFGLKRRSGPIIDIAAQARLSSDGIGKASRQNTKVGAVVLNLNSKGYSFDDRSGGKHPLGDLQDLLKGEYTSFISFDNCLKNEADASLHAVAAACRDLHSVNIELLKQRLTEEGAEPAETIGLWNSLTSLVSSTVVALGAETLLANFQKNALDLFELYENNLSSFDAENLELVQHKLIPNQLKVCELLGAIRDGSEPDEMTKTHIPLDLNIA